MLFDGFWRGMRAEDGYQRPKGPLGRFFEIVGDNLGRFLTCNVLCIVAMTPALAGIRWGLRQNSIPIVLAAGALGGAFFGPFYGATVDGLLYALRDVPGGWWKKYWHAWKRDWLDCLAPGAMLGAVAALIVCEVVIAGLGGSLPTSLYVSTGVMVAVLAAVYTYLWPIRAFAKLSLVQAVRNSLLICMAHPTVALGAVVAQGLYWGGIVVFLPHSLLLMPLLGLWFPGLIGLMIVYPRLNEDFRMEERLGLGGTDDGEEPEDGEEEQR